MKAQETILKFLLEGKRQYVVPLYQRRYAWTKTEWESFWVATHRQYQLLKQGGEAAQRPAHFFGSFVVHPIGEQASGLSSYHIIDGQQRFTTVFALLLALRDTAEDEETRQRLHESYLVNRWEKGDSKFKLLPGPHDRNDLIALIESRPEDATGLIGGAYRWLKNKLEVQASDGDPLDLDILERSIVGRLEVVDITTSAQDNAHRIFQTLNSTGRRLSQVDLLRNHFFMLMPKLSEDAYRDLWAPMEVRLGDKLDFFLWVDLVSRGGGRETLPRDRVYERWQQDLEHVEHDESLVHEQLKDIASRSRSYEKILTPDLVTNAKLAHRLRRLEEWGTAVPHPVVLKALVLESRGVLDAEQTAEALLYVESYMVRRLLTSKPTNNLNRIFTTTVAQLPDTAAFPQALRISLSSPGKYWPGDDQLRQAVLTEPFYLAQRPTQRQFILRRLEEALPGKEKPDWTACKYTLEHIMPQHLSPEWHEMLQATGEEDPVASHFELVHTLGNITLTCENSSLSDRPIDRKKQIFQSSMLKMNHALQEASAWSRAEIESRGKSLIERAIALWPAPVDASQPPEAAELQLVADTLGRVPEGRWTSVEDLGEIAELPAEQVRKLLIAHQVEGRELVLRADGGFETAFPWVSADLSAYKLALVNLTVLDDATQKLAPGHKRMSVEELAALVGAA